MCSQETLRAKAEKVASYIQGTCLSLETAIEQALGDDEVHLMDNIEFCYSFDDLVFECSECGWWCENSEAAEEQPSPHETLCASCADYE